MRWCGNCGKWRRHCWREYRSESKDRMQMAVLSDPTQGKYAVTPLPGSGTVGICHFGGMRTRNRTHPPDTRAHETHRAHLVQWWTLRWKRNSKKEHFSKYKQFVNNCFETCPPSGTSRHDAGLCPSHTGEEMFFTSPLPRIWQTLMNKWRNYISNREELWNVPLR